MFEYKVLTVRDARMSGSFDAESLEHTLNGHALDGWRLAEGFLATSLWKSVKAEIFLILERPAETPAPSAATDTTTTSD